MKFEIFDKGGIEMVETNTNQAVQIYVQGHGYIKTTKTIQLPENIFVITYCKEGDGINGTDTPNIIKSNNVRWGENSSIIYQESEDINLKQTLYATEAKEHFLVDKPNDQIDDIPGNLWTNGCNRHKGNLENKSSSNDEFGELLKLAPSSSPDPSYCTEKYVYYLRKKTHNDQGKWTKLSNLISLLQETFENRPIIIHWTACRFTNNDLNKLSDKFDHFFTWVSEDQSDKQYEPNSECPDSCKIYNNPLNNKLLNTNSTELKKNNQKNPQSVSLEEKICKQNEQNRDPLKGLVGFAKDALIGYSK